MTTPTESTDWTLVILPRSKLFSLNLRELIHYRDLVLLLAKRDISTVYKQTVLGPLWFVVQAILTTVVFTVIFGNLAKLSTDGIPQVLFYFSGTLLWMYFQTTLNAVSDTFVQNGNLFAKVYFPRLAVPLSKVLSNLLSFFIQLATFIVIYFYLVATGSTARPTLWVFALPLVLLWIAALASGFGMLISALTTKYRDLRQLLSFGIQLWMYATPIVYPLSQIPPQYQWIVGLNPVAAPIEVSRALFFGVPFPDWQVLALSMGVTVLVFFTGLVLFHKNEATFVDVA